MTILHRIERRQPAEELSARLPREGELIANDDLRFPAVAADLDLRETASSSVPHSGAPETDPPKVLTHVSQCPNQLRERGG
jgi:hypothetical protein